MKVEKEDIKYFNFPVQLLEGFLCDRERCLNDILSYSIYDHAENKLEEGSLDEKIKDSAKYFSVQLGSVKATRDKGVDLYNSFDAQSPKVGLNTKIYWDYMNSYKTRFEEVCLLAYLALKSIVQNKSFCKITNLYWLSRMDGNSHTVAAEYELSEEVKKYANEYQLKKIKFELSEGWNLVYYGRYTKGFYISFKMDLVDLIYEVEKKRKSRKMKQHDEEQKLALKKAMEKLNKK